MTQKNAQDNRANQLNPTHPAYHRSRGASPDEAQRMAEESRLTRDDGASPNSADEASRAEALTASPKPSSDKSE